MKTISGKFVAFAASAIALGCMATSQASAQGFGDTPSKGRIPFAFQVNHHTMPAGEYAVVDNYQGFGNVIALRNIATEEVVVVAGTPVDYKASSDPSMTFRCDDGCELTSLRTTRREVTFVGAHANSYRSAAVMAIHLMAARGK